MSKRRSICQIIRQYERVLLVILVVPIYSSAGCNDVKKFVKKKAKPPQMVEVSLAKVTTLAERLELTGSVEPTRVARMASPAHGPVIACLVREGDRVRTGQLLTRLGRTKGDDATALSAQAEMEREELELGRIEKLVNAGALPGEELDKARVKVSNAKARLARVMERLGDYRVVAPWSGVVSKVHVAVGDFVSARVTLIELFHPKSLVLRFAVPEKKAASIQIGAAMKVALDAYPDRTFSGKVTRVYPEIDRQTHTRIAEGALKGNVTLVPGMFARIKVTLSTVSDAVAIPERAVVRQGKMENIAFVVKQGGKVERRLLKTGVEDNDLIQIIKGVKPGERVVVAGYGRLASGMKVSIKGKGGMAKVKKKKNDGQHKDASSIAGAHP